MTNETPADPKDSESQALSLPPPEVEGQSLPSSAPLDDSSRSPESSSESGVFARAPQAPPPVVVAASNASNATAGTTNAEPVKRRPGRPRKNPGPTLPVPQGDEKQPTAQSPANAVRKLFVDPKQAATTIGIMIDGAFRALAEKRYGADAAKRAEPSEEEKKEIADAFELFMRSANVQLSPGANLALAVGGVYGTRAVMLEMTHRQSRKVAPSVPVIG